MWRPLLRAWERWHGSARRSWAVEWRRGAPPGPRPQDSDAAEGRAGPGGTHMRSGKAGRGRRGGTDSLQKASSVVLLRVSVGYTVQV